MVLGHTEWFTRTKYWVFDRWGMLFLSMVVALLEFSKSEEGWPSHLCCPSSEFFRENAKWQWCSLCTIVFYPTMWYMSVSSPLRQRLEDDFWVPGLLGLHRKILSQSGGSTFQCKTSYIKTEDDLFKFKSGASERGVWALPAQGSAPTQQVITTCY